MIRSIPLRVLFVVLVFLIFYLTFQISELYGSDPLELELGLEYWCPVDPAANATQNDYNQTYQYRPPQRQV